MGKSSGIGVLDKAVQVLQVTAAAPSGLAELCAATGLPRATAHRLAKEGAHVVCADLSEEAAKAAAKELTDLTGLGIGVSGTGSSGGGAASGLGGAMAKGGRGRAG